MTRPQLIQEWRANLLTLVLGAALSLIVAAFLLVLALTIGQALYDRRKSRIWRSKR